LGIYFKPGNDYGDYMQIGWLEIIVAAFLLLGCAAAFVIWLGRRLRGGTDSPALEIARERYAGGEISKLEFETVKKALRPGNMIKILLAGVVTLIALTVISIAVIFGWAIANHHDGPIFNIGNNFPQAVTVYIDGINVGKVGPGQTKIFYPGEISNPEYIGPNVQLELKSNIETVLYSRLFSPEEFQAVLESVKGQPYWIGGGKTLGLYLADTGERVLSQDDIKAYWSNSHSIELNFGGIARWNSYIAGPGPLTLAHSLFSRDFILKLNDTEICRGKFYSLASSASFKGITIIDALFPLDSEHDQLWIISDYPGLTLGPEYAGVASDLAVAFAEVGLLR
jgi:uncharacterized membrane protein